MAAEAESAPTAPRARRVTRCIPLASLALTPIERRKIDRYLDVTKSAFLFGGRVLLAEGIAEALLLPVIAKKIVLKDDAEKLRLIFNTCDPDAGRKPLILLDRGADFAKM